MKKIIFFVFWVGLLVLSILTLIRVTPLSFALSTSARLTNYIQRALGLISFTLLFIQVLIGAFMPKLVDKLGSWIFKFHLFEGKLIYLLVLMHPIFFLLTNHFLGGKFDPYIAFINVCLLCKPVSEYYYTLGRISFWLLTIAVFAASFRSLNFWMKANWRKFHVLNYLVFLIIGAHGFLLGTDFRSQPFFAFALIAYVIILGIIILVELPRLFKNFREWVTSS